MYTSVGDYQDVGPGFYTMLQPQFPLHPGAPGWTQKPWVTWGNNPNLRGPRRLGVPVGTSGFGAYYANKPNMPINGLGCGCSGPRPSAGIGQIAPETSQRLATGLTIGVVGVLGGLLLWSMKQEGAFKRNRRRT